MEATKTSVVCDDPTTSCIGKVKWGSLFVFLILLFFFELFGQLVVGFIAIYGVVDVAKFEGGKVDVGIVNRGRVDTGGRHRGRQSRWGWNMYGHD